MATVILITLGLAGIANIITRGYIMQPVRDYFQNERVRYLLQCPMCVGFWLGILYFPFMTLSFGWWAWLPYAGLVSATSSALTNGLDSLALTKTRMIEDINKQSLSNQNLPE